MTASGRAAGGDVAVGLGQGELGAGVGVERGEAAVAVGATETPRLVSSSTRIMPLSPGCDSTVLPRT